MNKSIPVLAFIFFAACSYDSSGENEANKLRDKSVTVPGKKLTLESFSEFPPEVEGCSCYFSADSAEFANDRYIYVDNLDETAYLKINGKLTKFAQISLKKHDEENWTEIYRNGPYKLTIDVKQLEQNGDETWLHTGTIRLTDQSKHTVTRHFYGECGC